jgi:hypothetical protein
MSKGPSTFRKNDVKRACEALEMTGKRVARVEIDKAVLSENHIRT